MSYNFRAEKVDGRRFITLSEHLIYNYEPDSNKIEYCFKYDGDIYVPLHVDSSKLGASVLCFTDGSIIHIYGGRGNVHGFQKHPNLNDQITPVEITDLQIKYKEK